jgi:transposase
MAAMTVSLNTLPDNPSELKTLIMDLAAKYTELEAEYSLLNEHLRLLRQKHFGASSEKVSDEQLLLMLAEETTADRRDIAEVSPEETVTVAEHKRARGGRRPLPENLERIEVVHDLKPDQKICPHDGRELKRIGEEVSEQLSYRPAEMRVIRHVRPKYACPLCEEGVSIAPPAPQLIPKSMAGPSLLAHIAVSKYADALPLYRQTQIFSRHGVDLPRSTLSSWMIRCGEAIQPLINLLRDELLQGPIIGCDETRFQVLKEQGQRPQRQSYLWVQLGGGESNKPVILFDYDPSRGGEVPKRLLAGFEGYLQTDGYVGYDALCDENDGIRRVGCWAHARRKFDEAFKILEKRKGKKGQSRSKKLKESHAFRGLNWIRKLYDVERLAKEMSAEERYQLRQKRSRPIIEDIAKWRAESAAKVPPKTYIGKAFTYLENQWKYLIRYLEDGRLEIDNNKVENVIRPFAVGRRNWLFSDTVAGAEASTNLYSLIVTAKANGLEPYSYLSLVFRDLPKARCVDDYEQLLPSRWSKETVRMALDDGEIPV